MIINHKTDDYRPRDATNPLITVRYAGTPPKSSEHRGDHVQANASSGKIAEVSSGETSLWAPAAKKILRDVENPGIDPTTL